MGRISDLEQQILEMQTDFTARLETLSSDASASRLTFLSAILVAVISTGGVLGAAWIARADSGPADPRISCGDVYQDAIVLHRVDDDWRYPAGSDEQAQCDVNGFLSELEGTKPAT